MIEKEKINLDEDKRISLQDHRDWIRGQKEDKLEWMREHQ